MGFAVYLKDYLDIRCSQPGEGFFDKRPLVFLQVFRRERVGHADDELVILVAQADGLAEPCPIVRFTDLDL